jgi:capsular polysaccharide biosynthesis protein
VAPWDKDELRALQRSRPTTAQLIVVVVIAVLGAGIAGAVVASRTPRYESRTAVLIDQPRAIAAAGDEGVIAKLSRLRSKYAGLLPTPEMLDPVARDLDLSVGEVASAVHAEVPVNSLLLTVVAESSDKAQVTTMSRTVGKRFERFAADEQKAAGIPADQRFTFEVVAGPSTAERVSPEGTRTLAVAATVGLVLLVVLLAAAALRPTSS